MIRRPPRSTQSRSSAASDVYKRQLRVLAVIAAAAVVVTGGVGWLLVRHYTTNITRKNVFANLSGRPDRLAGKAETVLLVGSDSRAGAVNGQFQGSGADFVDGARSDTAILAHLSADRSRALLVSIPRDSYVAIPACPDATGVVHPPVHDKFNARSPRAAAAARWPPSRR